MRKKLSKKQIGAMGLAIMMGIQTSAMAAETTQEAAEQETVAQETTQESATQEAVLVPQTEENETAQVETVEFQTEEAGTEEAQTEEIVDSVEISENETESLIDQYLPTETQNILEDGWYQDSDGKRTYVKDGVLLKNCVEKIGDFYYCFDRDGIVYVDEIGLVLNEETQEYEYYRAKEDGSLYVNEWYKNGDTKCYYGEGGKAYSGLCEVDGKRYYFGYAGCVCRNIGVTAADGKHYYCDSEGNLIDLEEEGWIEIDGKHLYIKNGEFLTDCVENIDGFYYGFDRVGNMYVNESFDIWDSKRQEPIYYCAKEDGKLREYEWYEDRYYGREGKCSPGLKRINGDLYYFGWDGRKYTSESIIIGSKNYYCKSDGIAVELQDNSWSKIDGISMYVRDGKLLKRCVAQIDGSYYGFDHWGSMYENKEFDFKENEIKNYYRAKIDGSLYVNEWYEDRNSKRYYYGEGGKKCSGFQTIDGKQYYFSEEQQSFGVLYRNRSFSTGDGKNYYSDAEGIVSQLADDRWMEVDGKHYYIRGGEILKNCIAEINGVYYAFDMSGIMYVNGKYGIHVGGDEDEFWASPSGALYVNKWDDEGNAMFYYGSDARKCKGIQVIDGVTYAFRETGILVRSNMYIKDGINYYCDGESKMHVIPDNEWYLGDNGYWYYAENGILLKNRTAQIDGKWYYFDDYARMQTQGFNANADGSLRISEWFYDGTYWYYYDEHGKICESGIYEIAGAKYYFRSGRMAASEIIKDDNTYYVAAENGYLTQLPENGWVKVGKNYYYAENGEPVTDEKRKIDGAYYVFDRDGKMCTNDKIYFYFEQCRVKEDGSLYASQWYQAANGSWYYYDQNAEVVNGRVTIGQTVYLFNTKGELKINGAIQENGKYYLADENGIWVQTPGWFWLAGCWYYIQEDGSLYTGELKDGGYTYYMDPVMVTNIQLKVVNDIVYNIDASGHMSVAPDGFYYEGSQQDTLYYVSNGKTAKQGWNEINGKKYYFGNSVTPGMYRIVSDYIYEIDDKRYWFNADGTLASQGWKLKSDGTWYYVLDSGAIATGNTWIDGTLYHFNDYGISKKGVFLEDGVCNLYSEDGILLETGSNQGWNLLGGNYYYLSNGALLTGIQKFPDGKWYYFDSRGKMCTNGIANDRWCGESGEIRFGWIMEKGKWYYASSISGRLYKGLHVINGVKYYFDESGIMRTADVLVNGTWIMINENGVVTGTRTIDNGWSQYEGEWYYYQNGKPYTGWVGDYYVSDGHMICNSEVTWKDSTYYLGEDGAYLRNAWNRNGKYYAKADGTLARSEWVKIDGKLYYFNPYGEVVKGRFYSMTDSGIYAEDGAYISATGYEQGWVFIDGNYYYKEGDNFITWKLRKINGNLYWFDAFGKMQTGFYQFYYGEDGTRQYYIGWHKINNKWYYFNEESMVAHGWQIINGVRYYFGADYAMYTGYHVVDYILYYFDANGACQGVCELQDGWYQADGNWYYIRWGHAVVGERININDIWYEFDENGIWIAK